MINFSKMMPRAGSTSSLVRAHLLAPQTLLARHLTMQGIARATAKTTGKVKTSAIIDIGGSTRNTSTNVAYSNIFADPSPMVFRSLCSAAHTSCFPTPVTLAIPIHTSKSQGGTLQRLSNTNTNYTHFTRSNLRLPLLPATKRVNLQFRRSFATAAVDNKGKEPDGDGKVGSGVSPGSSANSDLPTSKFNSESVATDANTENTKSSDNANGNPSDNTDAKPADKTDAKPSLVARISTYVDAILSQSIPNVYPALKAKIASQIFLLLDPVKDLWDRRPRPFKKYFDTLSPRTQKILRWLFMVYIACEITSLIIDWVKKGGFGEVSIEQRCNLFFGLSRGEIAGRKKKEERLMSEVREMQRKMQRNTAKAEVGVAGGAAGGTGIGGSEAASSTTSTSSSSSTYNLPPDLPNELKKEVEDTMDFFHELWYPGWTKEAVKERFETYGNVKWNDSTLSSIKALKVPILEVGCGGGQWTRKLHEMGVDIIGTDNNADLRFKAEQILSEKVHTNADSDLSVGATTEADNANSNSNSSESPPVTTPPTYKVLDSLQAVHEFPDRSLLMVFPIAGQMASTTVKFWMAQNEKVMMAEALTEIKQHRLQRRKELLRNAAKEERRREAKGEDCMKATHAGVNHAAGSGDSSNGNLSADSPDHASLYANSHSTATNEELALFIHAAEDSPYVREAFHYANEICNGDGTGGNPVFSEAEKKRGLEVLEPRALVYVGEGNGGVNADAEFFKILMDKFYLYRVVEFDSKQMLPDRFDRAHFLLQRPPAVLQDQGGSWK